MNISGPDEKQQRIFWISITALSVALLVALVGLLLWGTGWLISKLSPVLLPLAIAGVLAYLLDPIVDFLVGRGVKRTRAIVLVFLTAAAILLGFLAAVVPRLVYETKDLLDRVPTYGRAVQVRVETWSTNSVWGRRFTRSIQTESEGTNTVVVNVESSEGKGEAAAGPAHRPLDDKAFGWAAGVIAEAGKWLLEQLRRIASWFGLLVGFALVPVYVFYFLQEKAGIQANWTNYLPLRESSLKREAIFILNSINDALIVFFRGQVLVAVCTGTLLTVGFLVIGIDYAVLLGLMAGLLGIIPYLGVMISIVPAVTLAAVQYGDWLHPVAVLALFAIVNLLEGFVISPKIIGDRVGLHPLTIIVAVMVGTTLLGGIVGGVLAIPLTAALRAVMQRYVWNSNQDTRDRINSQPAAT